MRGLFDHPLLILVGGALVVALLARGRPPAQAKGPTGHRRTVCPKCDRITMSRNRYPLEPPREKLCRWCRADRDETPRKVMRREACPGCGRDVWSRRHYPPDEVTGPPPVSPVLCPECLWRGRTPAARPVYARPVTGRRPRATRR